MLYRLVGSSGDVDDLQQVVMLKVLTSLPRYRGESALSTWVAGICVNVSKDHFRRRKVRSIVVPASDSVEFEATTPSPQNRAASREALEQASRALQALSPSQRTAFMLRTVYGHSIEEVASIMGSAKSTTKMRIYYGKKAFTKAMHKIANRDMGSCVAPLEEA